MTRRTISYPLDWPLIKRIGAENARAGRGKMRAFVLGIIRSGGDPAPADVAAALREPAPVAEDRYKVPHTPDELRTGTARITPERHQAAIEKRRAEIVQDTADLCEYVAQTYILGTARKPGRKTPTRSLAQEHQIIVEFHDAQAKELAARARGNRNRRQTLAAIKAQIADRYGIKVRTLETILRGATVTTTK